MDSNVSVIAMLMARYARHETLTDEERRILEEWWQSSPENREVADQFADEKWVERALASLDKVPRKKMWKEISRQLDEMDGITEKAPDRLPSLRAKRRRMLWFSVSAASVLLVIGAIWLLGKRAEIKEKGIPSEVLALTAALRDEGDAIWTDSAGRPVPLGAVPVGGVVSRAGRQVLRKVDTFALAYDTPGAETGSPSMEMPADMPADSTGLFRNCLAVGRNSSPYYLRMVDGNAVWLGGGARLQYTGNSGDVAYPYRFTGKALFDIVKNLGRPLVIHLPNGKRIKVEGTRFYVESHADSPMSKVAIFSGNLRLFDKGDSIQLRTGQEAITDADGIVVQAIVDSSAMMAWAGNSLFFHFNNTEFESTLSQVAAWYGLKISNPGRLKGTAINSDLPRSSSPDNIIQILKIVESGYVTLRLEQNVIVVADWPGTR
ncbi:MAG TPA: hypothetical protein VGM89_10340 [Puia sp.]|jgi:ferric-dicitrate binding protein FerR (iron transport regulator)